MTHPLKRLTYTKGIIPMPCATFRAPTELERETFGLTNEDKIQFGGVVEAEPWDGHLIYREYQGRRWGFLANERDGKLVGVAGEKTFYPLGLTQQEVARYFWLNHNIKATFKPLASAEASATLYSSTEYSFFERGGELVGISASGSAQLEASASSPTRESVWDNYSLYDESERKPIPARQRVLDDVTFPVRTLKTNDLVLPDVVSKQESYDVSGVMRIVSPDGSLTTEPYKEEVPVGINAAAWHWLFAASESDHGDTNTEFLPTFMPMARRMNKLYYWFMPAWFEGYMLQALSSGWASIAARVIPYGSQNKLRLFWNPATEAYYYSPDPVFPPDSNEDGESDYPTPLHDSWIDLKCVFFPKQPPRTAKLYLYKSFTCGTKKGGEGALVRLRENQEIDDNGRHYTYTAKGSTNSITVHSQEDISFLSKTSTSTIDLSVTLPTGSVAELELIVEQEVGDDP